MGILWVDQCYIKFNLCHCVRVLVCCMMCVMCVLCAFVSIMCVYVCVVMMGELVSSLTCQINERFDPLRQKVHETLAHILGDCVLCDWIFGCGRRHEYTVIACAIRTVPTTTATIIAPMVVGRPMPLQIDRMNYGIR